MFNKDPTKDPTLVVMILQHNIIVSHSDQTVLRKAFESSPVVGWKPSLTSFREAMVGLRHRPFTCGGLVIEETKKTVAREIFSDDNKWNGRSMDDILSQKAARPVWPSRIYSTDFASTNPFNLDTYSCLWLETVDGHPDLPPSALNPLNAPRGVSGIKDKIGRPSTLFQRRSRDRCSSEVSLTGTAAERYGSARKTKLNLPLLGSKSARSISNSSQIPTPNGTTHGTTNDGGLFRYRLHILARPRRAELGPRSQVTRCRIPGTPSATPPGVQADSPHYVRCRWPWAQGVPVADNPHRTIHSLCPKFGYFFFHICMDSRLAMGASTAQATKMPTLDLRKCFSISFFLIILVGPHLDHARLGRNIANIQSPGFTNVKVDSSSVALGDLAGVMDARRPQSSKLEPSVTAPCIYLAGFGIAAAPFKLKFLATGVASRSLGQWIDQYYGSRPKPESLEQDVYLVWVFLVLIQSSDTHWMDLERGVSADGGEMIIQMEWKLKLGRGPKNVSLPGCIENLSWVLRDDCVIMMFRVQPGYGRELMRASSVLFPHH
ncbi:hypothetical protein B0H14DRAFT_3137725 [Mycena olivaceomarginata]|nr:hypothetical protein B0H14DRAFT_3137725 [Mycena olivaceomarginata]